MLKSKSLAGAIRLANAHPNLELRPRENSPLGAMVDILTTNNEHSLDLTDVDFSDKLAAASVVADASGFRAHDYLMDDAVKVAGATVSRMLQHARNVVKPLVIEYTEAVDAQLKRAEDEYGRLDIQLDVMPELYNSPIIRGGAERYATAAIIDLSRRDCTWPELSVDKLIALLQPEREFLEGALDATIQQLGEELLLDTYGWYFRSTVYSDARPTDVAKKGAPLAFCLARAFNAELPDGIIGEPVYVTNDISNVMAEAGRVTHRNIVERDRIIKNQLLFARLPHSWREGDGKVVVYGECYRAFIAEGGSPELLFGVVHAHTNMDRIRTELLTFPYTEILAEREKYVQAWEKCRTMESLRKDSVYLSNLTRAVRVEFGKLLTQIDNGDKFPDLETADRGMYTERFNKWFERNVPRVGTDLRPYLRRIVCDVFYPHSKACHILESIDDIVKSNPELDPRAAAALVTIDMVTEWAMSMVVVRKST